MKEQNTARIQKMYSRREVVGGMLTAAATLPLFSSHVGTAFAEAAATSLTDGTYTSSQPGMNDDVEVSVTIAGGKISDVQITSNSETPGIGGELTDADKNIMTSTGMSPVDLLPTEIVENNSIGIDVVSGATITSTAILNAVADCITQAGGNPDDFATKPSYPAYEDGSADVVVIGGGGAGLVAALAAAQEGKTVAIIEKNGECGGDTLVCGGIFNAPDPDLQAKVEMTDPVKTTVDKALALTSDDPDTQAALEEMQKPVQEQWDEYKKSGRTDLFDSKEWFALQTWTGGDMVGKPELVKTLTYSAYDYLMWLSDLGWVYKDKISQVAGSLWQRCHTSDMPMGTGLISVYANQLVDFADQITVYTEATASELVSENGKITGVVATDNHNGSSFTISCNDGAILATGGFSANKDMIKQYNTSGKWPDLSDTMTTNRRTCSQGMGIDMALTAGASLTDMDQIQLLFLGNLKDGGLTKYPPRCLNGIDQLIFVNKDGERFVQEDGRRDQICLAVLQQPDAMFYELESGDGAGYVDITSPDWRSADGFTFQYLVDNGYVFTADALDALAEQLEMDPATLQATVDTFNASVDSGEDEFGRTLYATKLENGPWVATPRQACIHHTMGGVTIDTTGHVLDENGDAIEGLYAGGEVTGGIHGGNRLGGNAVDDTVIFGNISARALVDDSGSGAAAGSNSGSASASASASDSTSASASSSASASASASTSAKK